MKSKLLFVLVALFFLSAESQNLHDDANAASVNNEANTVTGWNTTGGLTSDATDPQLGSFSMRFEQLSSTQREASYAFVAVTGEDYTITIWAKRGSQSTNPAFGAWSGLSGFSTTQVASTNWTQYTWNVTATRTNCVIRVYSGKSSGSVGDHIFLDNISIVPTTPGDTEAPSAVTDVAGSNTTMVSTDLSWTAATDNVGVTDYEVFQDGVSVGFTGGATTFNATGLAPSTNYAFTVFARDAVPNIGSVSNTANVTTASDSQAPSAVTNLAGSGTTDTSTNLSWTASIDNVAVTDYEVFQDGVSIGFTGGPTTFNVTGLTVSTSYAFTVFARDAIPNISAVSNTANVTTSAGPDTEAPSAVVDLVGSNITMTSTDLSWTASIDNVAVTDYEVFQNGVSIGFTGGSTTFNVTGLTLNTSYAFTVFARDVVPNISAVSNTANITTASDTQAPSAAANLAGSATTETSTDLSWTASIDNVAVTDYEVFQDGVSIGFTGGATTFNVTGLTASTSYAFTVFARDAVPNISAVSNTANVTTPAGPDTQAPSAVTTLAASNTTSTTTNLSWASSTDNVGVTNYEVFQDGISIGFTGGATTFNVGGLTAITSYAFTVFARDAVPNISAVSNTANITTSAGGGITDYTSENANLNTIDWNTRDLFADRNVGIGTTNTQGYRLAVAGNVVAEEIKVALQTNWPDYVFENNYNLPTLKEVEAHINKFGHLINIPSAKEVEKSGIKLGDMNGKLLRKIEELTLYTIEQQKKIENLEGENETIRILLKKVLQLEKELKAKK
jgi:chitodextrinase